MIFLFLFLSVLCTNAKISDDDLHRAILEEIERIEYDNDRLVDMGVRKTCYGSGTRKFNKLTRSVQDHNRLMDALGSRFANETDIGEKISNRFMEEKRTSGGYRMGRQQCFGEPIVDCNKNDIYRRIDGQCNNLKNPLLGAAGGVQKRMAKPSYHDKKDEPRGGFNGIHRTDGKGSSTKTCRRITDNPLPLARVISNTFHPDINLPNDVANHFLMQFGQFTDHDMTFTPETEIHDCCEQDPPNEGCFNIEVPGNDPFFSSKGKTCMALTRSLPYCQSPEDRKKKPGNGKKDKSREQMNGITAYIDNSNIYGSDEEMNIKLRTLQDGLLATSDNDLVPFFDGDFQSGDVRVSEMPGLAAMHSLFIREHNRIAKELKTCLPSANDETLYEETRRIVIAETQNIMYGQYLTIILGDKEMKKYDLQLTRQESRYDHKTDPSIFNEFSTAAYRFPHSLIQGSIEKKDPATSKSTFYDLKDNFFDIKELTSKPMDFEKIISGLYFQRAQRVDRFVTDAVKNHLFPILVPPVSPTATFEDDLIARNIQRGRDHGIPSYSSMRKACGLSKTCDWRDRPQEISNDQWQVLGTIYEEPEDIDLFVAGLAETPVDGGLIGPTFACIIGRQFRDLKFGDRFFFTHGRGKNLVNMFNQEQRDAILARTLSDIICDNAEINNIRQNVFRADSPFLNCAQRQKLDVTLFAPSSGGGVGIGK